MDTDKTDTESKVEAGPEVETDLGTKIGTGDATPGLDVPVEVNGPKGPEPTRYGDWEQKGRCSDF
jgi:hypothetical protein